ncbi:type IV pilin protein [Ramlibacter humi]|uniref:Prepilin-type N-terminal cleavage/methylation domain-containing protein n=1 Tax=Ramlibacter humi TaxID=2530451 RepID=A0A4Z0BNB8_9BURK|nr:type IV pilin protein [Ramlibacter humi]TFZ00262.1 prepilin-type N-terminal cleavage/methylation domain-containing protein [Ramlibacter humi]
MKKASALRTGGFTLLEVMIPMIIIAVLTAIAFPSYLEHVARTRRADARAQLLQAAQFMQRFYAANDSFAMDRSGGPVLSAMPAPLKQSPQDGQAIYTLDIPAAGLTVMGYELRMEPAAGGPMASDKCGTLTLASDGRRGVVIGGVQGNAATVERCWK